MKKMLSFLIPCYRSQNTVRKVIDEIISVVEEKAELFEFEIIAINDCSPDNVLEVLRSIATDNPRLKVIDTAINRGKHAALMAGFRFAKGDIVICVDDDGQCPLNHLWELLEPLDKGYDVSVAKYFMKKQSLLKRLGSSFNSWMVRTMLEKPKGIEFSNFIARKKFVCNEIIKYQHSYPYLEGLTIRTTHNICMVPMEERERTSGSSGYTLKKSIQLWLNGCTAFSVKPLRISSVIGVLFGAVGFAYEIFIIIRKMMYPQIMAGYSSLLAVVLMIGGVMLVMMGLIGEYVGRIYLCMNNTPQYVLRELINISDSEEKGDI